MLLAPNTIEYHHADMDDNELTLLVEFDYTPGDPGRLNGRFEDCYPATDPEIEITSIYLSEASTPQSRRHATYKGHFGLDTPSRTIIHALQQLKELLGRSCMHFEDIPVNTELFVDHCIALEALNQGGFIGPAQHLVGVEVSDLLNSATISDIEAECWKSLKDAQ